MEFEKYVKDGMVAVLYSPGYGAGWSTWMGYEMQEIALYDSRVVEKVLADEPVTEEYMKSIWGQDPKVEYCYFGGADRLEVHWLPIGTQFKIDEYDGYETVIVNSEVKWNVA